MSGASIERSVTRAYLLSVLGVALAIVVVSAIGTAVVGAARDDADAVALARTLGSELENHRGEAPDALDELVRHELEEQRWFRREIEVWQGGRRLGGGEGASRLRPWLPRPGCAAALVEGAPARVCRVATAPGTVIVVASPLRPMILAWVPLVATVAASAALAALVFAAIVGRLVRRSLRPLQRFERRLDELRALSGERLPPDWGAREIDQLAGTFNALLGRLDASVEQERRFVSNAAHELRTPLTRLRGQIELVLLDHDAGAESLRRLGLAVRTCEELGRAIDSLLALARDAVGEGECVDLGEVACEVLRSLGEAEAHRVRLVAGEAPVRGDEVLLTLAARNLLDNALKYSEAAVEVVVERAGGRCSLAVRDQGPGIPDAELDRVREAFVRGQRDSGRVRGNGLGLALAEHVARLHGGSLTLANRPDGGLTAALHVPADGLASSVAGEGAEGRTPTPEVESHRGPEK